MATKKDYIAIAKIIKDNTHNNNIDATQFTNYLSEYFKEDNPYFDWDRFLEACGI